MKSGSVLTLSEGSEYNMRAGGDSPILMTPVLSNMWHHPKELVHKSASGVDMQALVLQIWKSDRFNGRNLAAPRRPRGRR